MKHKTIIQFIFGAFFLIILSSFYFKYFSSNKQTSITQKTNDNSKSLEAKGNLIKDMKYENTDISGNKYFIYSEYGEVDVNNSDIILMKNVFAKVEIFKKDTIYINSLSNVNYPKRLLNNFYKNKGFFNAVIESSFANYLGNDEFEIIYNISSGKKFYLSLIHI